jgi:hypothetical protein
VARVQLALNVPDIDDAVEFYARMFDTPPNKRKPGYANFSIDDPPLKLVLFERAGAETRLNHLGVEVAHRDDVLAHRARLEGHGLAPVEESGTCCFADQEKIWVDAPDGAWEVYAVLADSDTFGPGTEGDDAAGDAGCCATFPVAEACCSGSTVADATAG